METYKHLLKILDISGTDIAKFAGITRQAVSQGSNPVEIAARALIEAARFDWEKMENARQTHKELTEFLEGRKSSPDVS